jgi:hypothetical protein
MDGMGGLAAWSDGFEGGCGCYDWSIACLLGGESCGRISILWSTDDKFKRNKNFNELERFEI